MQRHGFRSWTPCVIFNIKLCLEFRQETGNWNKLGEQKGGILVQAQMLWSYRKKKDKMGDYFLI